MLVPLALATFQDPPVLKGDGLHGYINASVQDAPAEFGFGVSLYSSAWPLLERPVRGLQIGLASTWILPDNREIKEPLVPKGTVARDSMPERGPSFWTVFQTIEGGLGFWTSNRYFAPTAKFRMNGSVDGYNHELSTPGWDFYGQPLEPEYMGIVQLSPRLLIPPDGVTLEPETCGELFGYAWMALPLVAPRDTPVKTGNQCWTAFLNTANFRGPIAFYLPTAWSKMSQHYPPAVGRGLDTLAGLADSGAIEIGSVPQFQAALQDAVYSKLPKLQFPTDKEGDTVLLHNFTVYSKKALWNQVDAWSKGGGPAQGKFDSAGAHVPKVSANPLEVQHEGRKQIQGLDQWVKTATLDDQTFGLKWDKSRLSQWKNGFLKATFPEYIVSKQGVTRAVSAKEIPEATGLKKATFPQPDQSQSYVPSDQGGGVWKQPGPKAGPYQVTLSDGSKITYAWYKFVDQPSIQHAGLSPQEKRRLQALVEKIHRHWTPDKQYMSPPKRGRQASVERTLLLKPPKGLEVGYVPVAVRQDPR